MLGKQKSITLNKFRPNITYSLVFDTMHRPLGRPRNEKQSSSVSLSRLKESSPTHSTADSV